LFDLIGEMADCRMYFAEEEKKRRMTADNVSKYDCNKVTAILKNLQSDVKKNLKFKKIQSYFFLSVLNILNVLIFSFQITLWHY